MSKENIIATNKKTYYNYEISDKYEAGIVLKGSEIKSIRDRSVSFEDSFCAVERGEIFCYNLHITQYKYSNKSFSKQTPKRKKKILLHRVEINKLIGKLTQRGFSLIPLDIHLNKRGICKLTLGLAKSRKKYDKRELIKKREIERELSRKKGRNL